MRLRVPDEREWLAWHPRYGPATAGHRSEDAYVDNLAAGVERGAKVTNEAR